MTSNTNNNQGSEGESRGQFWWAFNTSTWNWGNPFESPISININTNYEDFFTNDDESTSSSTTTNNSASSSSSFSSSTTATTTTSSMPPYCALSFEESLKLINEEDERLRISRFRFDKDKKLSLAGALLVRGAAAEFMQVPSRNVKIARTTYRKPYLQLPMPMQYYNFNISHSGTWVILVSDTHRLVGCDVEEIKISGVNQDLNEFFRHMRDCFTAYEWNTIRHGFSSNNTNTTPSSSSAAAQLRRFFIHWTCKESFIKALGIGLGFELQNVEFHFSNICSSNNNNNDSNSNDDDETMWVPGAVIRASSIRVFINGQEAPEWEFQVQFLDENHVTAVAYGPTIPDFATAIRHPARAPTTATSMSLRTNSNYNAIHEEYLQKSFGHLLIFSSYDDDDVDYSNNNNSSQQQTAAAAAATPSRVSSSSLDHRKFQVLSLNQLFDKVTK